MHLSVENLSQVHPQGKLATKVALEYLDEAMKEVEMSSSKEVKKISEELAKIKPHEKRGYITYFQSLLERDYTPTFLKEVVEHPNQDRGGLSSSDQSSLLEYLDEAVKIFEARKKPTTTPAEKI